MRTRQKEKILQAIMVKADQEAAELSRQLVRADSQEKEAIMAALEYQMWLAESCQECLEPY